jgi:hypothetical protein
MKKISLLRPNFSKRSTWKKSLAPRFPSILASSPKMFGPRGELSNDVQDIALELCTPLALRRDPEIAKCVRAIAFFELQIRIVAPKNESLQRQARMIATIKFLEAIEQKAAHSLSGATFIQRLQLPAYESLIDLLFAADGWRSIRSLPSTKQFDSLLVASERQASINASMVSLAYRFRKLVPASRLTGGKRMVVAVTSKLHHPKWGFGKRSLDDSLTKAGQFALLQYLILEQFRNLRPPRVASRSFAERLLKQSSDRSMKPFFAAYQAICKELNRQFEVQTISIPGIEELSPAMRLEPFSDREKKFIRDHYKVRGAKLRL